MQIGNRTSIEQSSAVVRIVFGPERGPWVWLSGLVSVSVFSVPVVAVCASALVEPPRVIREVIIYVVAMTLFAALLMIVATDAMRRLFGRDELLLDEDTLRMTTRLFFYRRIASFAIADIRRLRYEELPMGHRLFQRRIAFEYRGRTVGISRRITRQEGEASVQALQSKLARSGA
jgi:hypothetical protein